MRARDKNKNIDYCIETYCSVSLKPRALTFLKQGFHSVDF